MLSLLIDTKTMPTYTTFIVLKSFLPYLVRLSPKILNSI
ncbi:hypothetical protein LSO9J_110038 [Candidatus Liberibacter solanacearum]